MRPPSSTSDQLFGGLFGNSLVDAQVSDHAWLTAALEVEAALATASARVGTIPDAAAAEIAAVCRADRFDLPALGRAAAGSGNPVVPLVRALNSLVSEQARPFVHLGATSQDILDTAMSLVAYRALSVILDDLAGLADHCAGLAARHLTSVMPGRTLLQHALPTAFGLKCAGWLVAVDEARTILARVRDERLAIQLGGAAGTLASLEGAGLRVASEFAGLLGLVDPGLPWHTNRIRVAELASAIGVVSGVLGKIALDVALLAQTEVAEVSEGGDTEQGGSSTLPQKRNPVHAVLIISAHRRVPGLVATILGAMAQEHERAAGSWHAEWETIIGLLRITGGASLHARELLADLRVDAVKMRRDLELDHGLLMAESVAGELAKSIGRRDAHELVRHCSREAHRRGVPLEEALIAEAEVLSHLSRQRVTAALQPSAYLGSASELVDRALQSHASLGAGG